MAVLADAERIAVWTRIMREVAITGLTKTELRAVVDAVDAWVDTNAAAFNTAIPQPGRTALSTQQKAAILMYVAQRRFGVL